MDENQVVIIILTVIGSVFAFYTKLRKDIITEQKSREEPMKQLNENIITLNATIKFLTEMIESLKTRVTNHGSEIDDLRLQNQSHEERIRMLEKNVREFHERNELK